QETAEGPVRQANEGHRQGVRRRVSDHAWEYWVYRADSDSVHRLDHFRGGKTSPAWRGTRKGHQGTQEVCARSGRHRGGNAGPSSGASGGGPPGAGDADPRTGGGGGASGGGGTGGTA